VDSLNLNDWIGRHELAQDTVTPTPVAALSATLDLDSARPQEGVMLPPLWHWLYFLPLYKQSEIGADGHAKRGGFLPPVPLPRRMWAASQLAFHVPILVGDRLTRTSTIDAIREKSGRTGRLVFVRVKHEICRNNDQRIALTEFHDIVYRDAPRSLAAGVTAGEPAAEAAAPERAPTDADWERIWQPDDMLLFRYSALTFNAHRIHYDRRYVTEAEGYPGLVVHGPLIATLLLDLVRRERSDATVIAFEFRAIRPTFDLQSFSVCGRADPDQKTIHLWAKDHEGFLTMRATAQIA
jgi:3-methylfumaryl-CoA hydratase